jgi:hypothetical protein
MKEVKPLKVNVHVLECFLSGELDALSKKNDAYNKGMKAAYSDVLSVLAYAKTTASKVS